MTQLCRFILLSPFLFALLSAAQQPVQSTVPAGSNWQHVQALPIGTSIRVNAGKRHQACVLRQIDAETLTCTQGRNPVYRREEVTSIKITRRGRSMLVAAGIGAGVGAALGGSAAAGCNSWCIVSPGESAAVGGILFGLIGAPIGYLTDFTRSTIYRAP